MIVCKSGRRAQVLAPSNSSPVTEIPSDEECCHLGVVMSGLTLSNDEDMGGAAHGGSCTLLLFAFLFHKDSKQDLKSVPLAQCLSPAFPERHSGMSWASC